MEINSILDLIITKLKDIKGIDAIVLGGSRATDTATIHSDIDIGIYYNSGFDISSFKAAAISLDDERRADCITDIGEWGPWINGGGWLKTHNISVDFLFRDMNKVKKCISDCSNGHITIDYQCGHPFGFINSIYVGELHYCKVIYAKTNEVEELKYSLQPFSPTYKKSMIERFLWEAEFSLFCGKKGIYKNDVLYVQGSAYRAINCLIQVLFAANEMYCLNEKSSMERLLKEAILIPGDFANIIELSTSLNMSNMSNNLSGLEKHLENVKGAVALAK